jgi:hypothetical protein
VEIRPDGGVYDYSARYTAGATEFVVPASLSPDVAARCAQTAVTAHSALGLRDLSRSDLIVDASGEVWFLEVNLAPGMTETSSVPLAVEASGETLTAVCAASCAGRHIASLSCFCCFVDKSTLGRTRCRRVHERHDALKVLERRVLDGNAALGPAQVHLDARVEPLGEPRREIAQPGRHHSACLRRRRGARSPGVADATISSTARTDSPSATIRCASASCAAESSMPSSARAWPADSTPAATRRCTAGDSLSSRTVFVICGRDLPIRAASSSWVQPKSSRSWV